MKNLLSENMLRFGTKNLSESAKRELVVKSIMETIEQHGLGSIIRKRLAEQAETMTFGPFSVKTLKLSNDNLTMLGGTPLQIISGTIKAEKAPGKDMYTIFLDVPTGPNNQTVRYATQVTKAGTGTWDWTANRGFKKQTQTDSNLKVKGSMTAAIGGDPDTGVTFEDYITKGNLDASIFVNKDLVGMGIKLV